MNDYKYLEKPIPKHIVKQIRSDAIDEFVEKMKTEPFSEYVMDIVYHWQNKLKEQTE